MKKKWKIVCLVVVLAAVAVGGTLAWYNLLKVPHDNAVMAFEEACSIVEEKNDELQKAIDETQAVISSGETPLDETTIDTAKAAIVDAEGVREVLPALPDKTDDIIAATEKIDTSVDYKKEITALNNSKDALEESIAQLKQVTNPSEDFVKSRLAEIEGITGIQAATEDNDPNGHLGKEGWYTSQVFFSSDKINLSSIWGSDLISQGTMAGGSIETYETAADAESRDAYLANFDGSILSNGAHEVFGTMVIRVSDKLTASQQEELMKEICDKMIEIR